MDKSYLEIKYKEINDSISIINNKILKYGSERQKFSWKKEYEDFFINYKTLIEKEEKDLALYKTKLNELGWNKPNLQKNYFNDENIRKYTNLYNELIYKIENEKQIYNSKMKEYQLLGKLEYDGNILHMETLTINGSINSYNYYYDMKFRLYHYFWISFVNKINNINF